MQWCMLSDALDRGARTELCRGLEGTMLEPGKNRCGIWTEAQGRQHGVRSAQFPVRILWREALAMTNETINEILQATKARPYGGRGAVYRELRANYHKLAACLKETEPAWEVIAAAMARTGVVGARGNPPSRKSLPKVWSRVCRDVAAEEALRLTGVPRAPVRRRNTAPAGWRPPAFAQTSTLSQQPSPAPDGAATGPGLAASPQKTSWLGRPENEPSTAPPGSIQAARERANLRSGLMRDGTPVHARSRT